MQLRVVVDSNVFVAAFKGGEVHSDPALAFVKCIEHGDIAAVVPDTVLVETTAAIARETQDSLKAAQVADSLRSWSGIETVEQFRGLDAEYLFTEAASGKYKGMDVFVAVTALLYNVPLITLDLPLRRAVADRVPTPTLKELLE